MLPEPHALITQLLRELRAKDDVIAQQKRHIAELRRTSRVLHQPKLTTIYEPQQRKAL